MSFPAPPEIRFFSEDTRAKFINNADVTTMEKRCKQLLAATPMFMNEMKRTAALASVSPLYGFIYRNLIGIKWSMYALVVLLNLNIVMASYGAERVKTHGYESAAKGPDDSRYTLSLWITWVLGMINVAGYIVLVGFLGIGEIPLVIKETDARAASALADPTITAYTDLGAFR